MTICHNGLFTSESVSDGHPDKICDQISDAILDECLLQDPQSRVAVETAIKDHLGAVRQTSEGWGAAPDGKWQITLRYEDGQPAGIDTIVFSSQQNILGSQEAVEEAVLGLIIRRVVPNHLLSRDTRILINPTGRFEI